MLGGEAKKPVSAAVELRVRGRGLTAAAAEGGAFLLLRAEEALSGDLREVGRTEAVVGTRNPEWSRPFSIDYFFQERQGLQFALYQGSSEEADLEKAPLLGTIEATLGEIVASGSVNRKLKLAKGDGCTGNIIIRYKEVTASTQEFHATFGAAKLHRPKGAKRLAPCFLLYRSNLDGSESLVHRSNVGVALGRGVSKRVKWAPIKLPLADLADSDPQRPIRLRCVHKDPSGKEDNLGEASFTAAKVSRPDFEGWVDLEKKLTGCCGVKSSKVSRLIVSGVRLVSTPTFLDYVRGDFKFAAAFAIDFTASNGDPFVPTSLHYAEDPAKPNQYVQALRAVGDIIRDYDSDKLFPVWGFGAWVGDSKGSGGSVSQCFPVNGQKADPNCADIDGVIAAYKAALSRVELSGPTHFAPIIHKVTAEAKASEKEAGRQYFILLILTDGKMDDEMETRDAIIAASKLPVSIIIVGVGKADFSAMVALDEEGTALKGSTIEKAVRDCVQFVQLSRFLGKGGARASEARLAADVLAEIPAQFMDFALANDVKPRRPPVSPAPPTTDFRRGSSAETASEASAFIAAKKSTLGTVITQTTSTSDEDGADGDKVAVTQDCGPSPDAKEAAK